MMTCDLCDRWQQWRDGQLPLTEAEGQLLEAHATDCPLRSEAATADSTVPWSLSTGNTPAMPWDGRAPFRDTSTTDDTAIVFAPPEQPDQIGRLDSYQVVRRLGGGAMGIVYEGFDVRLKRRVAIKVLRPELVSIPSFVARFEREARSAGAIRHENVVLTYDVAVRSASFSLPYLVLEFVAGETLAHRHAREGAMSPSSAADIVRQVAEGLAAAHAEGVIHRDVKPSNILLEAQTDRAKVSDFGVARAMDGSDLATRTGQLVGTPAYMSPEQITAPDRADGRSDVFALGVVLYELITGERPFRGTTALAVMQQVLEEEPVAPRKLNVSVPRDLETIALKCLAKDPGRRYATAQALAEDLRRFRANEVILARPAGSIERLWRWRRRNPVAANLAAMVALLLVVLATGGVTAAFWFHELASQAEAARGLEVAARRKVQTTLAESHAAQGVAAGPRGQRVEARDASMLPPVWFAEAIRYSQHDPELERFNRIRFRNACRAAPQPHGVFAHDNLQVVAMSFHPNGRYLLSVAGKFEPEARHIVPDRCFIWDSAREQPLPWMAGRSGVVRASFSPDGALVAVGLQTGRVELYDFPSGKLRAQLDVRAPIMDLAFSPTRDMLAIAGAEVKVWPWNEPENVLTLPHPDQAYSVDFAPRGDRLATGCRDLRARVFLLDGKSPGEPAFPPLPHNARKYGGFDQVHFNVFSGPILLADGSLLTITGKSQELVTRWDAQSGAQAAVFAPGLSSLRGLTRVAGTNNVIVTAYQSAVWLDGLSGQSMFKMSHAHAINSVSAGPVGRDSLGTLMLTSSNDRTIAIWRLRRNGSAPDFAISHQTPMNQALLSPDLKTCATAQTDGVVKLWRLPTSDAGRYSVVGDVAKAFPTFAFSRDQRRGAVVPLLRWQLGPPSLRVFATATGEWAGPAIKLNGAMRDAALTRDGSVAATIASANVDSPGSLEVWNVADGKLRWTKSIDSEPCAVAFSADDQRLALLSASGQIALFAADDGRLLGQQSTQPSPFGSFPAKPFLHFTIDDRLVVFTSEKNISVWNGTNLAPLHAERLLTTEIQPFRSVVIDPTERYLAIGLPTDSQSVHIWDLTAGQPARAPLSHPDWVMDLRFSADGQRLATACRDKMARVFDWRSGEQVCPPFKHEGECNSVAFSPDGKVMLSCGGEGRFCVWDSTSAKPLLPAVQTGGYLAVGAILTDEYRAIGAGQSGYVHSFRLLDYLEPDERSTDELRLFGELIAGHQVWQGDTIGLTSAEWLERWRQWRKLHPAAATSAGK